MLIPGSRSTIRTTGSGAWHAMLILESQGSSLQSFVNRFRAGIRTIAKRAIVILIKGSSIKVRISVASGKLGDLSYVVLPTDVELPDEIYVNVVDIVAPTEVKVRLDSFMEKKVKVVHQVAIDPAPMHIQVGSVELQPDSVLVRGPRSYARGITEAKLESVKLSNVESKLKMVVPISSENRPNVTYIPKEVEIVVDVQEIAERLISGVPMELRGFPEHLRLVPNPPKADLKVSGGAEILALLDADDFSAYIDYPDYLRAKEAGSSEVSSSVNVDASASGNVAVSHVRLYAGGSLVGTDYSA